MCQRCDRPSGKKLHCDCPCALSTWSCSKCGHTVYDDTPVNEPAYED